ncbi:MAG: hypothetical protein QOF51_2907 [Chloroflexota bacterium]|nr:hypothetical protein [Chloroflexota bacterium]
MNDTSALQIVTQAVFGLLFILALADVVRHRDLVHLEVAALVGSLGLPIGVAGLATLLGIKAPWISTATALFIIAQPYLLLRLVAQFRPIPAYQRWIAGGALLASWGALLLQGQPLSPSITLALVLAFAYVEGYAVYALARAIRMSRGFRRRLTLAAIGSGVLGFLILLAGAGVVLPAAAPVIATVSQPLLLVSAIAYYVGFATPRWLRASWQMADLQSFVLGIAAQPAQQRLTAVLDQLVPLAVRTVGGCGGVVALGDVDSPILTIHADPESRALLAAAGLDYLDVNEHTPALYQAIHARHPVVATRSTLWGPELERLAGALGGAVAATIVPIAAGDATFGVLIICFSRSQIFIQDGATLLRMLAEQAAIVLETNRLYDVARHQAADRAQLVQQLEEQNARLEDASRLKSEFLANMSHELRTPLNAILGFSDLLRTESDGEYDQATRALYLQTIHSSGEHLLQLINEVLDLSKVEAGKMELNLEVVRVAGAVSEAFATIAPLAAKKSISTGRDIPPDLAVVADTGKVKQMLFNLLSNAIKFTPIGGAVTVVAQQTDDAVEIAVADTGIGIAKRDLSRLFREFQQLDAGPNRNYEGTGLGLALTKRLVELHGGSVDVESTPGEGTRFTLRFPLRSLAEVEEQAVAPAPPLLRPVGPPTSGPLVLVVDDDPRASDLLVVYLEQSGYRTEVATSGHQALERARAHQPFAITLDVLLPDLDGWAVLRDLKSDPVTRDVPVIVVSVVDETEMGRALGAVDYLVKPVDRQALLARLDRFAFTAQLAANQVRVLVADDDPAAVEILANMLDSAGFTPLRAYGGAEAIELALRTIPDLMLLDLMMPEVSGFDVVAALREDPTTKDVPILIVTAKELSMEDKRALNGHVAAIIQKAGLAPLELVAWLNRLVSQGTQHEVTSRAS